MIQTLFGQPNLRALFTKERWARRNRMSPSHLREKLSRVLDSKSKRVTTEWEIDLEDWFFATFISVPMADPALEVLRHSIVSTIGARQIDDRLTEATVQAIQAAIPKLSARA